jgi:hypothetical protein
LPYGPQPAPIRSRRIGLCSPKDNSAGSRIARAQHARRAGARMAARKRDEKKDRPTGALVLRFSPESRRVARAHILVRQATRLIPQAPCGARPQACTARARQRGIKMKTHVLRSCKPFCRAERARVSGEGRERHTREGVAGLSGGVGAEPRQSRADFQGRKSSASRIWIFRLRGPRSDETREGSRRPPQLGRVFFPRFLCRVTKKSAAAAGGRGKMARMPLDR